MEPFKIHEDSVQYRFDGVSGPKYLMRGPRSDFGLVVLMPGEDFQTHYHNRLEENFFTLDGEVDIYIDGEKMTLHPGELCHVPPKHAHYLINNGATPWKAVFVKVPYDPKDRVDVQWLPGEPVPVIK